MTPELRTVWELTRNQRWFSGHSRTPRPVSLHVAEPVSDAPSAPRSALLDVDYPDSPTERYHLPLINTDGVWLDACDDPDAMLALVAALDQQQPGFTKFRSLPPVGPVRRYGGEQSNTSVFFGRLLLKIFRRLEVGTNLDVEIHRALAGTGLAAEIYGVWQAAGTDLGVFLEALPDPQDGFVLAREAAASRKDFSVHAQALGESLAAVHAGLATALEIGSGARAALGSAFEQNFTKAALEVPQLAAAAPHVKEALDALGEGDFPTQRIHGDCHLGQVLLSSGRWRWVDFEGEPLKTLEERRLPDSPLRDLAGMLRSFDYAALDGSQDWLKASREAFLAGYGLAEIDESLLRAYELDKAVYEVVYEARNRPSWLHIPLRALGI